MNPSGARIGVIPTAGKLLHRRTSLALFVIGLTAVAAAKSKDEAAELFGFEKIHSAHLFFAPDQWDEIKPDEPARGPGGPGGRPAGPFNFSPGAMLVPGFQRAIDTDMSGTLTREEFIAGFDRWFASWDAKQQGFLDDEGIRAGMNKDWMPTFGQRPGSGGGSGTTPAPAAPGPGGPGFNLQGQDGRRNGLSGMAGLDFEYVHGDLELDGQKFSDVAVRLKGNGTYMDARNTEKKSFKIDLNEFVKGQKFDGLTKLNFHNNITDAAWMNESLAYALYREAGVPAPRTSYTRLAVTVPAVHDRHYFGLYTIVENPDTNWAKHHFDTKKGLILKPVTRELFIHKGDDWSAYRQAYDAKTDITESQVRRITSFARLVTSATDEEFAAKVGDYLDIDEFTRFLAVTVWLSSTDSILMVGQNYVVHLDPDTKKLSFAPWDLDRAFGNFFVPNPEDLSIRKAWGEDNRFLTRVMNVPAVRDAYTARLEEFQKTLFDPERLAQKIDSIAQLIRPAVAEEGDDKVARFDRALTEGEEEAQPNAADRGGFGGFRMPGARRIKAFITARHRSVADQLGGRSEGRSLSGGFGRPPGAPGGGGPPRGDFGPGRFFGPMVLRAADADSDGHVLADEFRALSTRWFGEWDSDSDGSLSEEQLRTGLAKAFPAPNFNGPGQPAQRP